MKGKDITLGDEEKKAREEQRRLSTWAAYDSIVADIRADLEGTDIDLSPIFDRAEWNRSYRDPPRSLDVPVELIARLAAR